MGHFESSFPRKETFDSRAGAENRARPDDWGVATAIWASRRWRKCWCRRPSAERLERIAAAVDWDRLGQVVAGVHAAPRGRTSYPPPRCCCSSSGADPQLEEALGDRLSFRRFVGLGLQDDTTTDHQPLSGRLEVQVSAPSFTEVALDAQGLVLKQGTLLDATLVAAQVRRPPLAAGRGARSATDPEPGRRRGGAAGRTSATRCIWGWMPTRGWCGGRR